MTKKTIIISSVLLLTLFVGSGIYSYNKTKKAKSDNIPLIPFINKSTTPTPTITRPSVAVIPNPQTDSTKVTNQIAPEISVAEIEKVISSLPIRLNDFATKSGLKTTINVYKSAIDENSVLRIEIYNINYNERLLTGINALAFKESFLEAKKYLPKGLVLKNIQIVYGNRQYTQDTATYWVKEFKLLD